MARQVTSSKLDALYSYRWHGDRSRLHIPDTAVVNNALFNLSGGTITIGEYAFFGHDVAVLTGTHDIEQFGLARQLAFPRSGRDVVIGEGVWLASHVLVLGPGHDRRARRGRRRVAGPRGRGALRGGRRPARPR